MIYISILLLVTLGGVVFYFKRKINLLKKQFDKERAEIRRDAKKRSGAVQWGLAIENFAPFLDTFPLRPEDVTFLGKPIDYVGYDADLKKLQIGFNLRYHDGTISLLSKTKLKPQIVSGRKSEIEEIKDLGYLIRVKVFFPIDKDLTLYFE